MPAALAAAPTAVTIVLLLLVTDAQGAYALRFWGPLGIFVLTALVAAGAARRVRGPALVALVAVWAVAAWALLSVLWADSPERALEGGARMVVYAGLFSLPLLTLPDQRMARLMAAALGYGLGALVLVAYLRLLTDPEPLFLAGRLDAPIGYRNGTAALFAVAFWPLLCSAAVRHSPALLRALAFSVALLALGMAFLTQSRGVLIGFVAGGIVVVALGPDRLRRTWLAILAVAALTVISQDLLEPFRAFGDDEPVSEAVIEVASQALGALALVGFVVVAALALLDGGLRVSERGMRAVRGIALAVLLVLAVGAAAGVVVRTDGDPVGFVGDKVQEFRTLGRAPEPGATRFGSTNGPRYDLWRVGLEEFRSAPVLGVGEGNYPVDYYLLRTTDRNVTNSHSLAVSVLAETGIVGAVLLVAFLLATAFVLLRSAGRLPHASRRWMSASAAVGAVIVAQSTVDWLWLIPGLAGLALLGAGLAVAIGTGAERAQRAPGARWHRRLGSLVPLAGALLLVLLVLSDYEVRSARADRERDPAAQLDAARAAERLNPFALAPRYLQAGALETLGRRDEARDALREALDREPQSFVTLTLLGDLELRARNRAVARRFYRRAFARNPVDTGLRELASP